MVAFKRFRVLVPLARIINDHKIPPSSLKETRVLICLTYQLKRGRHWGHALKLSGYYKVGKCPHTRTRTKAKLQVFLPPVSQDWHSATIASHQVPVEKCLFGAFWLHTELRRARNEEWLWSHCMSASLLYTPHKTEDPDCADSAPHCTPHLGTKQKSMNMLSNSGDLTQTLDNHWVLSYKIRRQKLGFIERFSSEPGQI